MKNLVYTNKLKDTDRYKIDKDGRVYSVRSKKWLKPQMIGGNKRGKYKAYKIKGKFRYAHRLVWFTYIGKIVGEINHKDCDKSNPRLDNLEDVSRKENIKHAHDNGLITKQCVKRKKPRNSVRREVIEKDWKGNVLNIYCDRFDCSEKTGIPIGTLSHIIRSEIKRYCVVCVDNVYKLYDRMGEVKIFNRYTDIINYCKDNDISVTCKKNYKPKLFFRNTYEYGNKKHIFS